MRATSSLTRMGAAAREQLRGASAVGSKTDERRRRALHGQHSRANARGTEHMPGDSFSGRCGTSFNVYLSLLLRTGRSARMAACWRPGELPSGGAAVEVLSSATVFLTGTAPTQTTAAELSSPCHGKPWLGRRGGMTYDSHILPRRQASEGREGAGAIQYAPRKALRFSRREAN